MTTSVDAPTRSAGARISGSDEFLRQVLLDAELPAVLPALAQATGDLRLVDPALRPPGGPIGAVPLPQGGMSEAAQESARELAFQALVALRDGNPAELDISTTEGMMPLLTFLTGELDEGYIPLLDHELDFGRNSGTPRWTLQQLAPGRESFRVVVIGAGMSGIGVSHRLKQAGLDVVVLEKNDEVGGTWYENSYPGCRLDTPNFTYSYSFFQKPTWRQAFTEQRYLRDYFAEAATELGVRELVRFNSEVERMCFDEASSTWQLTVRGADGVYEMTADAVVSAVGQLNRPSIPTFPGIEDFQGEAWHTAQWRHDQDLTGKKVAVIGTGASAFQVIPTIVPEVESMVVFQRNAPWMYPAADYHADVPAGMRWLLDNIPFMHRWYRFFQFYMNIEGRLPFMEVDPAWEHPVSVSAKNEELRRELQRYIDNEFADRPDLLAHALPQYPPGAKRMLRDNGTWANALKSPHVTVVHAGVQRIEPRGIVDGDGTFHEVDVIIYGTGFQASDFLTPMTVIGRGGVDIHEKWQGDLRAYYGVNIPDLPNFFTLYGPNTNLVINGSVVFLQEMGMEFILGQLELLLSRDASSIEVEPEAFATYNDWIDDGNAKLAWGASGVSSWYKGASGRVTQNWPYSMLDYWKGTHEWSASNFVLR